MKIRTIGFGLALFAATLSPLSNAYAQKKVKSEPFNVQNEKVSTYLQNSDATFSTKEGCFGQSFFDDKSGTRPDQPACKEITFRDSEATSAKVYLWRASNSKNKDFIGQFSLKDGVGACSFRNLVPGVKYKYAVVSETGRKIQSGSFETCGQVRMIMLDRGFNVRDLGGWKGLGGYTMRYEQIYRGGSLGGTAKDGHPSDITDADRAELKRIGVGAQLDLRAKTNAGRYSGEGSYHSYALGKVTMVDADYNNTMTDNGAYNEDASVISDIAWIIYELKQGRPVYFNCRQGADRTGTIAFVIEGLLGCYEYGNGKGANQMAMDYELTGFSGANEVDNWKVGSSCRPAAEAFSNKHKLFRQLLDLKASEPEITLATLQQKCYYYLNRYAGTDRWGKSLHIDQGDLDWFIKFMLNMPAKEYQKYKPTWAQPGGDLKEVGETCANVVNYSR